MAKKNAVPAKGAKLLRKVAKHILEEPLRYNQNAIISYGTPGQPYGKAHYPACGTVACIGGWLTVLTSTEERPTLDGFSFERIANLLNVSEEAVGRLCAYTDCGTHGWPEKLRVSYNEAKTPLQKARIANKRIEHFIATGE